MEFETHCLWGLHPRNESRVSFLRAEVKSTSAIRNEELNLKKNKPSQSVVKLKISDYCIEKL